MIDPTRENMIDLREVCRLCGPIGRPLNFSTVWRWILDGRGPKKVRLEVLKVGGRTLTSREALQRFLEALNPGRAAAPPVRTAKARKRAAEQADKELEGMGI